MAELEDVIFAGTQDEAEMLAAKHGCTATVTGYLITTGPRNKVYTFAGPEDKLIELNIEYNGYDTAEAE